MPKLVSIRERMLNKTTGAIIELVFEPDDDQDIEALKKQLRFPCLKHSIKPGYTTIGDNPRQLSLEIPASSVYKFLDSICPMQVTVPKLSKRPEGESSAPAAEGTPFFQHL